MNEPPVMKVPRAAPAVRVTHYLCPGWKVRQRSCASGQNLFPDSWVVNKVRLLHFHSAPSAFLRRLVLPLLSRLLLLISPEGGRLLAARLPL